MYKLLVVRYDSSLGSYDDAEFTKVDIKRIVLEKKKNLSTAKGAK
jgi:hypothetical protein